MCSVHQDFLILLKNHNPFLAVSLHYIMFLFRFLSFPFPFASFDIIMFQIPVILFYFTFLLGLTMPGKKQWSRKLPVSIANSDMEPQNIFRIQWYYNMNVEKVNCQSNKLWNVHTTWFWNPCFNKIASKKER